MGTDVDICIEVNINNKWQKIDNDYYSDRNYDVFSLLCGICDYYKCIPLNKKSEFVNDIDTVIYIITLHNIDSYKYWNTDFIDTSKEKFELQTGKIIPLDYYKYRKCGGIFGDISKDIYYMFYTMKPIEVLPIQLVKMMVKLRKYGKKYGYNNVHLYCEFN
ncbi:hypothetical protein [Acidithiobacillus sp.]|jgi:hypothetical protein|uniref:hypothetical protein n=1 Tax=Acidithiobacillus sp. TaxID=1872118 RepID=UPI0035613852